MFVSSSLEDVLIGALCVMGELTGLDYCGKPIFRTSSA